MGNYDACWSKLAFHSFDKVEYGKKIGFWKKGSTDICDYLLEGKNVGVVADTAAGKTIISLLSIIVLGKRTLFLAPQRLLAEQHHELMAKISGNRLRSRFIHGQVPVKKRIWNDYEDFVVFATPQIVVEDIKRGKFDISDFSLIVFDEMHRASGKYPYVQLAKSAYENGLGIIGLSASPGGTNEKIARLKNNLFLGRFLRVQVETPSKSENFFGVDPDENLLAIEAAFKELLEEIAVKIREYGVEIDIGSVTAKGFKKIQEALVEVDQYSGMYISAKFMKLRHAYLTAMTEGYQPMLDYLGKMRKEDSTKAGREIVSDERVHELARIAKASSHPKAEKLFEYLLSMRNFGRTALVFVSQKNTAKFLAQKSQEMGWRVDTLFGGNEKKIARQKQLLARLANREIDFIFTTSVAEEGLSIPEIDNVIHYSMPMTEVAMIQRSGRTGRMRHGNVIYIALDHPLDRGMYFASKSKAKKMRAIMGQDSEKKVETQAQPLTFPESRKKGVTRLKKKGRKRWVDEFTLPLFPDYEL